MTYKDKYIKQALIAYPGGYFHKGYLDNTSTEDLVRIARRHEFGDSLLSFIVLELDDVLSGVTDPVRAKAEATSAIDRAVKDIVAVQHELKRIKL